MDNIFYFMKELMFYFTIEKTGSISVVLQTRLCYSSAILLQFYSWNKE